MARFQVKLTAEATGKDRVTNRNVEAENFGVEADGHLVFKDSSGNNVALFPQNSFLSVEKRGAGQPDNDDE
jgi:hypothetical protein